MRAGAALLLAAALWAGAAPGRAETPAGGAPAAERLVGHGGPVMGLAATPDGRLAVTTSFDNAVGVWDLRAGARLAWLDGHDAAVNDAALIGDRVAVTGGDDFAVILWDLAAAAPIARLAGHQAKVQGVAVSPDGAIVASASWDQTIRLWRVADGAPIGVLEGHRAGVNDVAFSGDGQTLYSASSDGTVRSWRIETRALIRIEVQHGFGVNVLTLDDAAGWLAYGATDGVVRVLDLAAGTEIAAFDGGRRPILALARSPSGRGLAYGDGEGYISLISSGRWGLERDFRAVQRGPIWALAFIDEHRVLAGGLDDFAAIWPIGSEDGPLFGDAAPRRFHVDPETVSNGERQFARKCSVCHTLTPDGRRRAGPTLYGLFGRPAGTLADYPYSEALQGADLIWSDETLDRLFDIGPAYYTPGSKMPMQRITDAADRADLIAFLRAATDSAAEPTLKEPQ